MSKIEWTDVTWSPVTGCLGPGGTHQNPKRCSYCFAERMARRLKAMGQAKYAQEFAPAIHQRVLDEMARKLPRMRKARRIFVCDMADLFGSWVPRSWIAAVLDVIKGPGGDRQTWQLLTKNPERLAEFGPYPPNIWVGASATDQASWDRAASELQQVAASVRFISAEPLLGYIEPGEWLPDWLIIGAQTGPCAAPVPTGAATKLALRYRIGGMTPPGSTPPPLTPPGELALRLRLPGGVLPPALFVKDNIGWADPPQDFPEVAP